MKIQEIKTVAEYNAFVLSVYKEDSLFKDNKTDVISLICSSESCFAKNANIKMLKVTAKEKTLCQAVFIIHKNNPSDMYVSFFESLENQSEAVALLMEESEFFAKSKGCQKLIIGVEGHCNNGLGFNFDVSTSPSFGECYSKPYYQEYFSAYTPVYAVSYYDTLQTMHDSLLQDLTKNKHDFTQFSHEFGDFSRKNFTNTMKRYTDLNNEIFADHPYYFKREYEEDAELFATMRPLLRGHNLVFLKNGDEYIGYELWYPDFNEFVRPQSKANWLTYFIHKILRRNAKNVKVVEIGVKKKYRKSTAIIRIFYEAAKAAKKSKLATSSWILEENHLSKYITQRYAPHFYKKYVLFEKSL